MVRHSPGFHLYDDAESRSRLRLGKPLARAAAETRVGPRLLVHFDNANILERDVKPYIIGRPKVYDRGSTFVGRVWITNDFTEAIEDAQVSWQIVRRDTGDLLAKNDLTWSVGADGAEVVDEITWAIPSTADAGEHRVEMQVESPDGTVLSSNHTDIVVR